MFTWKAYEDLLPEQKRAIFACYEYLAGTPLDPDLMEDEEVQESFDLLRECEGCLPDDYTEEIDQALIRKFKSVYYVGLVLCAQDLTKQGFDPIVIVEPSFEDRTRVAIVDADGKACFLVALEKAWHMGFSTLEELSMAILWAKKTIRKNAKKYRSEE